MSKKKSVDEKETEEQLLSQIFNMVQETKVNPKRKINISEEERQRRIERLKKGRATQKRLREGKKAMKSDGGKAKETESVQAVKTKENLEMMIESKEIKKDDGTVMKVPVVEDSPPPPIVKEGEEPETVKEVSVILVKKPPPIPKRVKTYLNYGMF